MIESNTPENFSVVVDCSNPFVISNNLYGFDNGRFGSVKEDKESLVDKRMHMLGLNFAQYPPLDNQLWKVVANDDEKAPKLEIEEVTSLAYNNVIDVVGEHIKKDVPAIPLLVVIIDSDDEDDRERKSDGPFLEVVLPTQVRPDPALKMIVKKSTRTYMPGSLNAKGRTDVIWY